MNVDLHNLREAVLAARRNPAPRDAESEKIVSAHQQSRDAGREVSDLVVTQTGEIMTIDQLEGRTRGVSRVTTEVFAAAAGQVALAAEYLPADHRLIEVDGVEGWVYDITTRQGHPFTFFLYRDAGVGRYLVALVEPALESLGLDHQTHLYGDGQLCLDPLGAGQVLMQEAYAKSVLWADGIGQMVDGHGWPWGE